MTELEAAFGFYDVHAVSVASLIGELTPVRCPMSELVVAGYRSTHHAAWLVWSVDGQLRQAFCTEGTSAVLANGCMLVTSSAASVVEGWDLRTGELVWRRADRALPGDSSGNLQSGTIAGASVVAMYSTRHQRHLYMLRGATGADISARGFTPDEPLPEEHYPIEMPALHRLSWSTDLRNAQVARGAKPGVLSRAIAAWLAEPFEPLPPPLPAEARRLRPSAPVARQLARLAGGGNAVLTVDEASAIHMLLGPVSDDVLAMFAIHSPRLEREWNVSVAGLRALHAAPPFYAKRLRRLRMLAGRTVADDSKLLGLYPDGELVATADRHACRGPQSLAGWLSEVAPSVADTAAITFAIENHRSQERSQERVVTQPTLGRGTIIADHGDTVTVSFEQHGERRIKATFLTHA